MISVEVIRSRTVESCKVKTVDAVKPIIRVLEQKTPGLKSIIKGSLGIVLAQGRFGYLFKEGKSHSIKKESNF